MTSWQPPGSLSFCTAWNASEWSDVPGVCSKKSTRSVGGFWGEREVFGMLRWCFRLDVDVFLLLDVMLICVYWLVFWLLGSPLNWFWDLCLKC